MNGSNGTRPGSNGQHPLANLTGARLSYELPQAGHTSSPFAYRPPALHAPSNPPNRRPSGDVAISPSTGSSESSPATGTSGGAVAAKSNGKATTVTKRASSGKEDERERDNKKARQALSCSECKRRKIKCDRSIPCSACIKRGEPESCSWEEAKIEPAPQPFALVKDLHSLATRLAQVEAFLQTLPPELRTGAPQPQVFAATYGQATASAPKKVLPPPVETGRQMGGVMVKDEVAGNDVMEDAAAALEGVALGARAPGPFPYRPTDPVPYLENMITHVPGGCGQPPNPNGPGCSAGGAGVLHCHRDKEGGSRGRELTRALTCIVSEPMRFENAPCQAAQMGLDIDVDMESLPAAWKDAFLRTCRILPSSKEESLGVVTKFFTDINWMHHALMEDTFMAEHDWYWDELIAKGRQTDVCPFWVSTYCMVLALGYDGEIANFERGPQAYPSPPRDPVKSGKLYAAAQRLLDLGDWRGRPQMRVIHAILLFSQFQQLCTTVSGQATRALSWLASGIRIAQIMGLHTLGTSAEQMPIDDAAWPAGKNSMKREVALKGWWNLFFLDSMLSSVRSRFNSVNMAHVTSGPIANVDYSELSRTDWQLDPKPITVTTDSSFERFKAAMGMQSREVFDKLVIASSEFSYDTVLELDHNYRKLLSELPAEDTQKEKMKPELRWKRLVCREAIEIRICRLHRPFLTRGYTPGSRFAFSKDECIKSASFVINNQGAILDVAANLWMIYSHTLAAAIVLSADLFHAIDHDASEQEVEDKKNTLCKAFDTFGRDVRIPSLKIIVQQGRRILSGLFLAEEKRRATRAAHTLVGTAQPVESFAQVLQGISRDLETTRVAKQHPLHAHTAAPSLAFAPSTSTTSTEPQAGLPLLPYPSSLTATATPPINNIFGTDEINDQFFRDLGLPPMANQDAGGSNGVNGAVGGGFGGAGDGGWGAPSPFAFGWGGGGAGGTDTTPPDFAFLSGTNDWGAGGQVLDFSAQDPNSLAANALLDQLAGTW